MKNIYTEYIRFENLKNFNLLTVFIERLVTIVEVIKEGAFGGI